MLSRVNPGPYGGGAPFRLPTSFGGFGRQMARSLARQCHNGASCSFAHSQEELLRPQAPRLCRRYDRGFCNKGAKCQFAHGSQEPTGRLKDPNRLSCATSAASSANSSTGSTREDSEQVCMLLSQALQDSDEQTGSPDEGQRPAARIKWYFNV
ncbi:unnamed protein product [Effrenium voratum]|nr:unnamed protein product [Effrenium voratum]